MLEWQDSIPRFVIDEQAGNRMSLYFDSTNVDDIRMPRFHYLFELVKLEDRWLLLTKDHHEDPGGRGPQVYTLINKLKQALQKGVDFDFRNYLNKWRKRYKDFDVAIRDTTPRHE